MITDNDNCFVILGCICKSELHGVINIVPAICAHAHILTHIYICMCASMCACAQIAGTMFITPCNSDQYNTIHINTIYTQAHAHTCIYVHIHICVCMCLCVDCIDV